MDLSTLNMHDIGKEVLSGCSRADMTKLVQNMDSLLPAIGRMGQLK